MRGRSAEDGAATCAASRTRAPDPAPRESRCARPAEQARRRPAGRSSARVPASSAWVCGCRGAAKTSAVGRDSTIVPSCITSTRSHMLAITARSCVMKSSAAPSSATSWRSSSSICGLHRHVERGRRLVGDQDGGIAGRAPLRAARAAADRLRAGGDTRRASRGDPAARTRAEQLLRAGERLLARRAAVQAHDLRHLLADPHQRIEGRHRLLEHHRDPVAAQVGELPLRQREEVASRRVVRCRWPAAPRAGRPITASAVSDLPLPDSPISPTRSPAASSKLDAVDERGLLELDPQVAHREGGLGHSAPSQSDRGCRAVRRRAG